MPGGNTKSDSAGIAIIASPPSDPQSAIRNPQSDSSQTENPQSAIRNPQSDSPQSETPRPPSPTHFSILQYATGEEQNVRVKPLPRAFHPQPLNYDQRI